MYRGLTMQNMADELYISLRNYQRYESGETSPTLEGLVHIANLLNVPMDYLLGRDEYLKSLGIIVDIDPVIPPRRHIRKK